MLIGINPLLSPDLLSILRAMGHGDEIVIADANFPGFSTARQLVRLDGISAPDAIAAILSVMPLDSFVDDPAISMENASNPTELPTVVQEFQDVIDNVADCPRQISQLERFAFYERAKSAFAIVQTGELRHFGNLIIKKGVLQSGG